MEGRRLCELRAEDRTALGELTLGERVDKMEQMHSNSEYLLTGD